MTLKTPCIIYTPDAELARRLKAFAAPLAEGRETDSAVAVERALHQSGPALLFLDMRSPEGGELLQRVCAEWPDTVIIALGILRSDPMRAARDAGVFASEYWKADRLRIQAHMRRALNHLNLVAENQALREGSHQGLHPATATPSRTGSVPPITSLPHFSRAIRHFDNLDILLEGIVRGVADTMMVSRAGIFSTTRDDKTYRLRSELRCLEETSQLKYTEQDPLTYWLEINAHMIARANLGLISNTSDQKVLQRTLDEMGAEVIVPMFARDGLIGWLFVGHRATGQPFVQSDLENLLAVTEHSAMTIENALLYEEVAIQKTLAETVLQSMPTGIVAIDNEARVGWYNRAAGSIFEKNGEGILNGKVESLGTQVSDLLRRALLDDHVPQSKDWTDAATGKALTGEARQLTDNTTKLGAVALIHDNTDEHRLRVKEEEVERAAFWAELAASMSHEVRNPLVAISTFAQLLPERYDDPEFRSQFSELVTIEVDRLKKIIEQINDFAYPPKLEFKDVDINETLLKSLDLAKLRIPQNGVQIDTVVKKGLPPVHGDAHALSECFAQLITNALEASLKGKKPQVTVKAESAPSINGTPGGVTVTVKDNGEGIPEDVREKVFSPFCTTKARGMGLGLPIARRTVVDHDGQLDISSDKKGTAVSITLQSQDDPGGTAS